MDSTWSRSQGRALKRYGVGGERADRADLHGVAAEVRGERLVREGVDLRSGRRGPWKWISGSPATSLAKRVQRSHRMQRSRSRQHEVADRDRLLEVALLLDEAALARAVGQRLVLQRALAALVADRAVERVVDQQELEHAVLGLLGDLADSVSTTMPAATWIMQAGCSAGPAARVDLDEAHAAHAHRLHALVVAEARDVDAGPLGGVDDQLALARPRRRAVDRDGSRCRTGDVSTSVIGGSAWTCGLPM